jgi:RNA polymerase sigma-70 factor (ECF subfamily)
MSQPAAVTEFERHRAHLTAVAYRMLGTVSDAEDAVQEAYLRFTRTDPATIRDVRGWLTTVVSRICLDELTTGARTRPDARPPAGRSRGAGPGSDPHTGPQRRLRADLPDDDPDAVAALIREAVSG